MNTLELKRENESGSFVFAVERPSPATVMNENPPPVQISSLQSSLPEAHPAPQRDAGPATPIGKGNILVRTDLSLPIPLDTCPVTNDWKFVRNTNACQIERALRGQDWYFFYLVPDAAATGFARSSDRAVQKALERVFAKALANRVNTVEIALVAVQRVLGFWRAKLVAKMRHIQHGPYLFSTVEEMQERESQIVPEVDLRLRELLRRAGMRLPEFGEAEPSHVADQEHPRPSESRSLLLARLESKSDALPQRSFGIRRNYFRYVRTI